MASFFKTVFAVSTSIVVTGLLFDQMQRGTFGSALNTLAKRVANGYGDFDDNNGV